MTEYQKQWYEKNKKRILEYSKQWYQLNKEKRKEYYQLNKERSKQYNQLNRKKQLEYKKQWHRLQKEKVINYYSEGSMSCGCAGCTENQIEFLTIDHSNNDGAKHRKKIGCYGNSIHGWLIKNNFPDGFRILCWNCNAARSISSGANGICPHIKLIQTVTGVAS